MNYSISDIKSENILSVFTALTREAYMTREELAERCRLSLTTVGKIINRLHDYGILSQKHIRSQQSGRLLTAVSLSDSALLVIFCVQEKSMAMELTDLHLRPLSSVHQNITPDNDPSETLLIFLLRCRRELETQKHLLMCGLIAENSVLDSDTISRAIENHLKLSVSVLDHTANVIARAAGYEGIAKDDRLVAILSNDGSCGGGVIYRFPLRKCFRQY